MFSLNELRWFAPEVLLLSTAVLIVLIDGFLPRGMKALVALMAQVSLVGAIALTLPMLSMADPIVLFHQNIIIDPLSALLKTALYLLVLGVFIYGRSYIIPRNQHQGEYYILTLFSVSGMSCLVSANSLLMVYLGLELMSLPLYALIAMQSSHTYASEASMKYFVMGGIASGFLLYGMSLLFGMSNTLVLSEIAQSFPGDSVVGILAVVMMVTAIAFKLGAVPFHMWMPDVYEGAPTDVTALMATAPKIAAFGMLYRLLVDAVPQLSDQWMTTLWALALLSLIVGNIIALSQTNIKRLLAYSTISHMGFVLLGFTVGTLEGQWASLFYVLVYAFTTLAAFGGLLYLSNRAFDCEQIDDLRGLSDTHPWVALLLMVVVLSLAGVPPTVGFYAKLVILESLMEAQYWLAAGLAMLLSVVGAFYYLRLIRVMYFEKAAPNTDIGELKPVSGLVLTVNSALALAMGLAPMTLYALCSQVLHGS